ncbi:MAG: hypothetical protein JWM37_903 [Candidatus Saccharibacteria bacterium]|nr:hypothetical protein [Candidatus Saccharibacteria bacterium]
MSLREDAPQFRFDELHPLVADSMVVTSREEIGDEVAYQVDFRKPLGGMVVAQALHEPLWPIAADARLSDITKGLRSIRYPNSRLSRMVRRSHHRTITDEHRREVADEGVELAEHIEASTALDPTRYRFSLPVYDNDTIRDAVQDDIRSIKPLELKTVAARAGIEVDDLAVWRLQRPRSKNRPNLIDDYLANMSETERDELFDAVQDDNYFTFDAQDNDGHKRTVSVRRDELPRFFKSELVGSARLGPPVRASAKDRVPTRPVTMRMWPDKSPSAAYAKLRWVTGPDGNRALLLDGGDRRWSRVREQFDRTSAVLGPVLLAATADVDYGKPLRKIWTRKSRERKDKLPRSLSGVMPLLLRHKEAVLLGQRYIVEAEAAIDGQIAERAAW